MTNTICTMPTVEEIDAVFESMLEQRSPGSDVCHVTVAQLSILRHVIADQMRKSNQVGDAYVECLWNAMGQAHPTKQSLREALEFLNPPNDEEDAEDARRYRWLRDKCDTTTGFLLGQRIEPEEWDAAIDAAMKEDSHD